MSDTSTAERADLGAESERPPLPEGFGVCLRCAPRCPKHPIKRGDSFCTEGVFRLSWETLETDRRELEEAVEGGRAERGGTPPPKSRLPLSVEEILRHGKTAEVTFEQIRAVDNLPAWAWGFCDPMGYAICEHCVFWDPLGMDCLGKEPMRAT